MAKVTTPLRGEPTLTRSPPRGTAHGMSEMNELVFTHSLTGWVSGGGIDFGINRNEVLQWYYVYVYYETQHNENNGE